MMRSESRIPFSGYLILSLLLHLLLWIFPSILPTVERPPIIERVEMTVIETQPEAIEAKPKMPIVEENKKIVDQDKLNEDLDEKAKFLSSQNQKVIKQTIAQQRGEFKNKASKPVQDGGGSPVPPEKKVFEDFVPKLDVAKAMKDRQEMEEKFDQDADFRMEQVKKREPKPQVAPQQKQAATPGGDASQTLDYIKELDPGLETMLSTKEFKYYTYFSRIRVQLNQHWSPRVRQKVQQIYKSGRSIASSDDMITRCLVTLDKSGKLLRIQIIGDSGIRELDEAAVEAFRAAAPFPNPPKGMVDGDGTIKIRWDFILEA